MTANQNWVEVTSLRRRLQARRLTQDLLFTRILEEIDRIPERVGIAAATLNIEKLAPLEVTLRGSLPGGAQSSENAPR
jgi:hypothetical protein